MGLSSLPTPSESVLTLLVVNTALTISIFKEIFRSALQIFGLTQEIDEAAAENAQEISDLSSQEEANLTERFRSRTSPVRFGSDFGWEDHRCGDCRVCFVEFEPESMVNRLSCGHLFHKNCVEKWIGYRNTTCPLCRTNLLAGDNLGRNDSVNVTDLRSHF